MQISQFFSDKHINQRGIAGNPLQRILYRFAYPFASLLNRIGLTPDQITGLSLAFACCAFAALVIDDGAAWFSLFWGISILLDYCDGTVARMSNRISKSAFRFDHMSDIFKIALITFGIGVRNDDILFWSLCSWFMFSYAYSELLSHDLAHIQGKQQEPPDTSPKQRKDNQEPSPSGSWIREHFPTLHRVPAKLYAILFTFNGHTLLAFFALPIGGWTTVGTLAYLILLTLKDTTYSIRVLRATPR